MLTYGATWRAQGKLFEKAVRLVAGGAWLLKAGREKGRGGGSYVQKERNRRRKILRMSRDFPSKREKRICVNANGTGENRLSPKGGWIGGKGKGSRRPKPPV